MTQNFTGRSKAVIGLDHLLTKDAALIEEEMAARKMQRSNVPQAPPWAKAIVQGQQRRSPKPQDIPVKQEPYCEVKKLPIDVLADLWGARYGMEWVEIKAITSEDFYSAVAQRLLNEGYMDRQVTTNSLTTTFRLKEM